MVKRKNALININNGNIQKVIPSEHEEQVNVISWANSVLNVYPELCNLFAVPNASKCSYGAAKFRKQEGLSKGVPDLVLAVQNKDYGSLYIEMKKNGRQKEKNGGSTDSQIQWRKNLCRYGMLSVVCYSFEEARDTILAYLANKETKGCALVNRYNLKETNNGTTARIS